MLRAARSAEAYTIYTKPSPDNGVQLKHGGCSASKTTETRSAALDLRFETPLLWIAAMEDRWEVMDERQSRTGYPGITDIRIKATRPTRLHTEEKEQDAPQEKQNEDGRASFFQLPRELRDMIYDEVILWERPRPTLNEKFMVYDPNSRFKKIYEPQSSQRGEYGCAYSLEAAPTTCANFLSCNRQVYQEMGEALQRLQRRSCDLMSLKLDCMAEDESFHYFTWLGVPLVKTTFGLQTRNDDFLGSYVPVWMQRWLASKVLSPLRTLSPALHESEYITCRSSTTQVSQLWIDIRLIGNRSAKWFRNSTQADRTGWAICAALKQFFAKGRQLSADEKLPALQAISVDELVLNVVSSPGLTPSQILDEDVPLDRMASGQVHPKTVAEELVDVWSKIWKGEDFKGIFYAGLLEKIGQVRICIAGETFKTRELRNVLERGRYEQRMITNRQRY